MEIYADFRQKVNINLKDVIDELQREVLGFRWGWVIKEKGKYYRCYEVGLGSHSTDARVEISKEKFEYIKYLNSLIETREKILKEEEGKEELI